MQHKQSSTSLSGFGEQDEETHVRGTPRRVTGDGEEDEGILEKNLQLEEYNTQLREQISTLHRQLKESQTRGQQVSRDHGRLENELEIRIEVMEKLRSQYRQLELEKKEIEKRYRDQADSFDSERQVWYDQENHYKSRIQNMANRLVAPREISVVSVDSNRAIDDVKPELPIPAEPIQESTPAQPTELEESLQLQLASLTTLNTSLTSTLRTLQSELSDLKRVYQDLQDENESYEILLGERTLNGEVTETAFFRSSLGHLGLLGGVLEGPGGLATVGEDTEDDTSEKAEDSEDQLESDPEKVLLQTQGTGTIHSGAVSAGVTRTRRSNTSPQKKGAQSGLGSLAAEIEAAEQDEEHIEEVKKPKSKKWQIREAELQADIKTLKDANKALTLYVSKIVDRVCSQEGFEKVLAVDYRLNGGEDEEGHEEKPTSSFNKFSFFKSTSSSSSLAPTLTRSGSSDSTPRTTTPTNMNYPAITSASIKSNSPTPTIISSTTDKSDRPDKKRIFWDSVSSVFFKPPSSAPNTPSNSLKPFKLGSEVINARKLDVEEDEEDIAERERIRAEMALHGLSPSINSTLHPNNLTPNSTKGKIHGRSRSVSPRFVSQPSTPTGTPSKLTFPLVNSNQSSSSSQGSVGEAESFTEHSKRRQRPVSMIASSHRRGTGSVSYITNTDLGLGASPGVGEGESSGSQPEPSGWGSKLGRRLSLSWGTTSSPLSPQ